MIHTAFLALFVLLALFGPAPAAGQVPSVDPVGGGVSEPRLLWPTDAGRCVTSSFCEFRPDHFHSGIDISTGGKTGFRCFAVGDGDIVRARVSCGGYGRAIYLKLRDGRTVVFAHLSRFAGELGRRVREQQEARGSAYQDLEFSPGELPVARGDVIGWTGQSGAGVPHLHMEIRDRLERPLDPLTEAWSVEDTAPPVVTRVAVTPLSPPSSVAGRFERVVVLTQNVDGLHTAAGSREVVTLHGDVHDLLCTACSWRDRVVDYAGLEIPPACPDCGGLVRPDVVLFGELLPPAAVTALRTEPSPRCDVVFSVGTSSQFPYITGVVAEAARRGLFTVEVNPEPTIVTNLVDVSLPLGAAEAFEALADALI